MKILLFGKNGQLGWELQRSLLPIGELFAADRNTQAYCADLSNSAGLAATIREIRPNIVVNAAAYTAVDKAETEYESAYQINSLAPGIIAEEAKRCGAWLIHYSTDYVFDGSGQTAWLEEDPVNPINVYGQTKLAGEQAIQATGCQHLIFRTSWVYAARGNNFAKIILRLAQERNQLNVVCDQIGAPTSAELLADVTAHAIRKILHETNLSGIYHLSAAAETNWCEYARYILDFVRQIGIELKLGPETVNEIATSDYPTAARRPLNSRLNTEKIKNNFDLHLPAWQLGVERMLTEVYGK